MSWLEVITAVKAGKQARRPHWAPAQHIVYSFEDQGHTALMHARDGKVGRFAPSLQDIEATDWVAGHLIDGVSQTVPAAA